MQRQMSSIVSRFGLKVVQRSKQKFELVRRIYNGEPMSSEQIRELDTRLHRIQMRSQICGFIGASIGGAAGITAFVQVGGVVTAMFPALGGAIGGAAGLAFGFAPVTVSSLVLVGVIAHKT